MISQKPSDLLKVWENSGFEVSELVAESGEQDNMTPPELAKADPEVSHDLYQKRR